MEIFLFGTLPGIIIGSAINALTYRWSNGLSMLKPERSFCPSCKKKLNFYELVPIISFLIQKGRCRQCGSKIGWRYPLGELGHGILWGLCMVYFQGWELAGWLCFCSLCWIVFWTDLENFWIPDEIGALLLLLGLMTNGIDGLIGGGIGLLLIGLMGVIGLVILRQDSVGHGDLKLMRGMGACLLLDKTLSAFFLAVFFGAAFGGLVKGFGKKDQIESVERKSEGLGSYLKCFLGYFLGVDILALLVPKVGHRWFGIEEEVLTFDAPPSALPFGSFLILGGYSGLFFQPEIEVLWHKYLEWINKTV